MYKIDLKSLKIFTYTSILCVFIALIIMPAYNYLPEESINISPSNGFKSDMLNFENRSSGTSSQEKTENKTETYNSTPVSNINSEETNRPNFEEIEELNYTDEIQVKTDTYTETLTIAEELKNKHQYKDSLIKFKEALNYTSNPDNISLCYEEIANINAIEKQYGIALYYAQKAYKIKPSQPLEILLAKLYYKTGDSESAQKHIDRIVKDEFITDR